MTIKQKQWQLYLLGYLGTADQIDGIWGMKSRMATLEFQMDHFPDSIAYDGIFGPSTQAKSREIIDNIQDVVTAYADTPLVNDGLAGMCTMEAVRAFQRAMELPVTGIVDKATHAAICDQAVPVSNPDTTETGAFWDEIEFFTEEEFRCKCGGRYCDGYPARMREEVVRICDAARRCFGRPGHVISGLRCPIHNANEGGVANSQHMYGEACDLQIEGVGADELLAFILAQPGVRYAYKINGTNVHFDVPKGKR